MLAFEQRHSDMDSIKTMYEQAMADVEDYPAAIIKVWGSACHRCHPLSFLQSCHHCHALSPYHHCHALSQDYCNYLLTKGDADDVLELLQEDKVQATLAGLHQQTVKQQRKEYVAAASKPVKGKKDKPAKRQGSLDYGMVEHG